MTLLELRRKYGSGDGTGMGFYPQDWWIDQPFASVPLPRPVPEIQLLEITRGRQVFYPSLMGYVLPLAVSVAHHFFDHWERTGEILWGEDYIWCRDRDTNGDQIYVGGYNLGRVPGFQVHRHMTINDHFVAAEEV